MKPHRFSEMLSRLVTAILPGASEGRQREEFAHVVYDYIQPEHGNRSEEIEALVLVREDELVALRIIEGAIERIPGTVMVRVDLASLGKGKARIALLRSQSATEGGDNARPGT